MQELSAKYQNTVRNHLVSPKLNGHTSFVKQQNSIDNIKRAFAKHGVTKLWHFTERDNLKGILEDGIMSHNSAEILGIDYVDISDPSVQGNRGRKRLACNRSVHDFAPMYINHKNAMLYKLEQEKSIQKRLCLLEIDLEVLLTNEFYFTDGNAANHSTRFFQSSEELALLPWEVLLSSSWSQFTDGTRKRMAEVLVEEEIAPQFIKAVHCYSVETYAMSKLHTDKVQFSRHLFF